eukprot:c18417_g1_i1 orf=206-1804(-)
MPSADEPNPTMEGTAGAPVATAQVPSTDAVALETEQHPTHAVSEAETHMAQSSPPEHAPVAGAGSPATENGSFAAGNGSLAAEAVDKEAACASVAADVDVPSAALDDAEHAGDAEREPSPVIGTLDDAQQFFDQGRAALRTGEYDQAAELLSRALEIRALHYGELAFECAFTYYKYGCALLYKAQSESDPLGEVKESTEHADTETAEDGKDEEGEEVEEEESDLDMAWKMLDIARVIYEKQESRSIEEVDVITALADVSLEREDFEMCFRDYTRALEILEGLVEQDDRGIAELCFKLSLAQQLGYKPKEALRYCQQAVSVCEARLRRLRNEVAIAKGLVDTKGKAPICDDARKDTQSSGELLPQLNSDISVAAQSSPCQKQEDEIKEIEQLLEDLRDKVVELQEMASGPSLLESLKETNPGAVNSIKQVFNVTAQLASQEGSSGSTSCAELSGGFDAPSGLASTAPVTHLGVVGRGVKRATPVPVLNGQEATTKKRSLDDMMTRGGAGDTQIGFGTETQKGFGTDTGLGGSS